MLSTTALGSSVLGTSKSGTTTLNLVHSSSRAPSGLQGTPLSPLTVFAAAFWLSGSRLKVLAFTTVPSAVPTRLSLVLKQGPKYTPLRHLSSKRLFLLSSLHSTCSLDSAMCRPQLRP
eukprot:4447666-Amphidinium_carterae.2